jgi:2,3-bisphosphoglycerate-dependent phosphoglycerate mutase
MNKTKIVAIRHGETEWNVKGKYQGQLDSPLTETGKVQSSAAGFGLTRFCFDAFYSSDLGRAVQTSEIISGEIELGYEYEKNLRERNLGKIQGLTKDEFREKHPAEFKMAMGNNPDYIIPDGESERQRFERAITCAETLAEKHQGGTLLLVTHGEILMSFMQKALNIPIESPLNYSLCNCAINIFTIDKNKKWHLNVWGDITHLDRFNLASNIII